MPGGVIGCFFIVGGILFDLMLLAAQIGRTGDARHLLRGYFGCGPQVNLFFAGRFRSRFENLSDVTVLM